METLVIEEEINLSESELSELDDLINKRSIVLYNDDVNTFDHVIFCLMEYCEHNYYQAEQCALIVHNNGKCSIKSGSFEDLKPIAEALQEKQLSVKIL
jgi:ATP-dependent Clp protease adaptor protein ClpS